jgi:hypothetical protein
VPEMHISMEWALLRVTIIDDNQGNASKENKLMQQRKKYTGWNSTGGKYRVVYSHVSRQETAMPEGRNYTK